MGPRNVGPRKVWGGGGDCQKIRVFVPFSHNFHSFFLSWGSSRGIGGVRSHMCIMEFSGCRVKPGGFGREGVRRTGDCPNFDAPTKILNTHRTDTPQHDTGLGQVICVMFWYFGQPIRCYILENIHLDTGPPNSRRRSKGFSRVIIRRVSTSTTSQLVSGCR